MSCDSQAPHFLPVRSLTAHRAGDEKSSSVAAAEARRALGNGCPTHAVEGRGEPHLEIIYVDISIL